jgi:hypothetical protein
MTGESTSLYDYSKVLKDSKPSDAELVLSGEGRAILYYRLSLMLPTIRSAQGKLTLVSQIIAALISQFKSPDKKAFFLTKLKRLRPPRVKVTYHPDQDIYNVVAGTIADPGTLNVWRVDANGLEVAIEQLGEVAAREKLGDALEVLGDCANELYIEQPETLPFVIPTERLELNVQGLAQAAAEREAAKTEKPKPITVLDPEVLLRDLKEELGADNTEDEEVEDD